MEGETSQEKEARKLAQARADSPSEFAVVDDIIHDPRAVFGDRFNYNDDATKDFKFIVLDNKDVFVHKELLCFFSSRMTKHLETNAPENFLYQGTKTEEEMHDFLKVLYDGREAARQLPRERFVQVVRNSIQYGYQFIQHNC